MRVYLIYLIKDEFAEYFYGRENKIVELFRAERSLKNDLLDIVKKQIDYITKPLPYVELHKLLTQSIEEKDIYIKGRLYCTNPSTKEEGAELSIGEEHLKLKAWGNFANELEFFEILRGFDGKFLAMDLKHNHYGWIKPIKEKKYV